MVFLVLVVRMVLMNLIAAWTGILLGLLAGVVMGLFFHKEDWLGGYNSWPRRLFRLGHIAFFGIAFLNFAFVITIQSASVPSAVFAWPGALLVVAQFTMPLVCLLAGIKKPMRHLFFVPVISAVGGAALTLVALLSGVPK